MGTFLFNGEEYKIDSTTVSFQDCNLLISGKGKFIYLNLDLLNIIPMNSINHLLGSHYLNKKQVFYSKIDFDINSYLVENLTVNISEPAKNIFCFQGTGKLFEEYDEDPRLDFSFEFITASPRLQ